MKSKIFLIILFFYSFSSINKSYGQNNDYGNFKNPLMFYGTDVLIYLQTLHENMLYEQMPSFFYGPIVNTNSRNILIDKLSDAQFGYSMRRVGAKSINKNQWLLNYQRTILGTQETFKIKAELVNDTCRIYLDEKSWKLIFRE